jgi:hypothetical protein
LHEFVSLYGTVALIRERPSTCGDRNGPASKTAARPDFTRNSTVAFAPIPIGATYFHPLVFPDSLLMFFSASK